MGGLHGARHAVETHGEKQVTRDNRNDRRVAVRLLRIAVTGEVPTMIESTIAQGTHVRLEYFEKAFPKGTIGVLPRLGRRAWAVDTE